MLKQSGHFNSRRKVTLALTRIHVPISKHTSGYYIPYIRTIPARGQGQASQTQQDDTKT